MRFDKIIFDFDHTLVEFGPHVDWRSAVQEIEGIYLDEGISPAVLEQSRGRGFKMMRTVYDHMLEAFAPQRVREVQARIFDALEGYELHGVGKAAPMEGARGLLSWLRANEYECAIVTSNGSHAVERTLSHLALGEFFSGVFGRDPSCRLKPYPDQNRSCLGSLGWQAGKTVLVGDSPDDIQSAKPLSIFTVGVHSGFAKHQQLIEAGADRTIQKLGEVPSLLQAVQGPAD